MTAAQSLALFGIGVDVRDVTLRHDGTVYVKPGIAPTCLKWARLGLYVRIDGTIEVTGARHSER